MLARLRALTAPEGLDLVGAAPATAWDAKAPPGLRAEVLLPGARGFVVFGSSGTALFRRFSEAMDAEPARWSREHPLEEHVAGILARIEATFVELGVRARRFEPTLRFRPVVDFVSLGEIVGLGRPGPFGLLVHPRVGPWFALRAAYLVDVPFEPPAAVQPPCAGCARPCVGGAERGTVAFATMSALEFWAARQRCVVGEASRYSSAQVAYHADPQAFAAAKRKAHGSGP